MASYKCIPAPIDIHIGKKDQTNSATKIFEDIMNKEAVDGWRYHSTESIVITQPKGCFTVQQLKTTFYMLIFEREY